MWEGPAHSEQCPSPQWPVLGSLRSRPWEKPVSIILLASASSPVWSACPDFPNGAFGLGVLSRQEKLTRVGAGASCHSLRLLFIPTSWRALIHLLFQEWENCLSTSCPVCLHHPPPLRLLYGFWQLISMKGQMVCISGSLEQSVPVAKTQLRPSSSEATVQSSNNECSRVLPLFT